MEKMSFSGSKTRLQFRAVNQICRFASTMKKKPDRPKPHCGLPQVFRGIKRVSALTWISLSNKFVVLRRQ